MNLGKFIRKVFRTGILQTSSHPQGWNRPLLCYRFKLSSHNHFRVKIVRFQEFLIDLSIEGCIHPLKWQGSMTYSFMVFLILSSIQYLPSWGIDPQNWETFWKPTSSTPSEAMHPRPGNCSLRCEPVRLHPGYVIFPASPSYKYKPDSDLPTAPPPPGLDQVLVLLSSRRQGHHISPW